jgi:hypothetical protein
MSIRCERADPRPAPELVKASPGRSHRALQLRQHLWPHAGSDRDGYALRRAHGCPLQGKSVRSNVLPLAVDRQIKHREVAQPMLDLQLCAYRPDLLGLERCLEPSNLPLFHGTLGVVSLASSFKDCMAELLH